MNRRKEEVFSEIGRIEEQIRNLKTSLDDVAKAVKAGEQGRIRTYIEGFDEVLGEGIEKRHIVLISGSTGTFKSSLALTILYNNLKRGGSKGLYLTLEESRESLLETMRNLNLDDFDEDDLMIIDVGRMRADHESVDKEKNWFRVIKDFLRKKVKTEKISLVVLDSLNALTSMADTENVRNELFHFFNFLKGLDITSFIIKETPASANGGTSVHYSEDFLSDGLIDLRFFELNGSVELRIRCLKLRHSSHSPDYMVLDTTNGRFRALPVNGHALR